MEAKSPRGDEHIWETCFLCIYGPSPFGAGLSVWSGGGGGKPFPASAWRQIYLEYIGFTEILSKRKALKRKRDESHVLSAQIWGETGGPHVRLCFSSVLGSSPGFGGPPHSPHLPTEPLGCRKPSIIRQSIDKRLCPRALSSLRKVLWLQGCRMP